MTDVAHYTVGDIETIDYIYDKLGADGGLQYVLGNILKYASRAEHKGQLRSDLIKIGHYAELALERLGPPEEAASGGTIVTGLIRPFPDEPRTFKVGDPEPEDKETIVLAGIANVGDWCRLQYGRYSHAGGLNPEAWWVVGGKGHTINQYASWKFWLEAYGPLTEVL